MATINPTFVHSGDDALIFTYANMANGDVGAAIHPRLAEYEDRTIQMTGTPSTGGSMTIQGSNNGSNYKALTDPQGDTIALTAAGDLQQIMEGTLYMRPAVTAGDGSTSMTATITLRKRRSA